MMMDAIVIGAGATGVGVGKVRQAAFALFFSVLHAWGGRWIL